MNEWPKAFPEKSAANDNEQQELDLNKVRELQLVFNQQREEQPEQELDRYRTRMKDSTDYDLIARFNRSTSREWLTDPRYFFIIIERRQAPLEDE